MLFLFLIWVSVPMLVAREECQEAASGDCVPWYHQHHHRRRYACVIPRLHRWQLDGRLSRSHCHLHPSSLLCVHTYHNHSLDSLTADKMEIITNTSSIGSSYLPTSLRASQRSGARNLAILVQIWTIHRYIRSLTHETLRQELKSGWEKSNEVPALSSSTT